MVLSQKSMLPRARLGLCDKRLERGTTVALSRLCHYWYWYAAALLALTGVLALECCRHDHHIVAANPAAMSIAIVASSAQPVHTGTLRGRVYWQGPIPSVPPLLFHAHSLVFPEETQLEQPYPNPNAPRIDSATQGVEGAIVFLRSVPAQQLPAWRHPPVRIEVERAALHVVQGSQSTQTGFVRLGDEVQMASRDGGVHLLRASQAAFFTVGLPHASKVRTRRLTHKGVVELTSASYFFWHRGYLFVDDHPYYTRTDAQGCFTLPEVPAGQFEIVCWMPSWHCEQRILEPDSKMVSRYQFRAPVEVCKTVSVTENAQNAIDFQMAARLFQP